MEVKKEKKRSGVFVNNDGNGRKTIPFPGVKDPNETKRQNRTAFIIGALTAIIGTVVGTLIVSMFLSGNSYILELLDAPKQIRELNDRKIPEILTSVENLEAKTTDDKSGLDEDIRNISTSLNGVETRIDGLYSLILIGLDLRATKEYSAQIAESLGKKAV